MTALVASALIVAIVAIVVTAAFDLLVVVALHRDVSEAPLPARTTVVSATMTAAIATGLGAPTATAR